MDEKNCGNCGHYFGGPNGESECRRYPPTAVILPRQDRISGQMQAVPAGIFAPTAKHLYCGEHEPAQSNLVTA